MDSGVKRSLNVDFVNTVYIYSILRRPAEDTAYIFEMLEACKKYSVRGKGS